MHDSGYIIANDLSYKILEIGGYSAYLDAEKRKEDEKLIAQKHKNNYYYWQGQHGKWLTKTKWLPLIFSVLALIISLIALFKNINH